MSKVLCDTGSIAPRKYISLETCPLFLISDVIKAAKPASFELASDAEVPEVCGDPSILRASSLEPLR